MCLISPIGLGLSNTFLQNSSNVSALPSAVVPCFSNMDSSKNIVRGFLPSGSLCLNCTDQLSLIFTILISPFAKSSLNLGSERNQLIGLPSSSYCKTVPSGHVIG